MGKIRIQRVSTLSTVLTVVLAVACAATFVSGYQQFQNVKASSQAYVDCEEACDELQSASNYLSQQTYLAVMTSDVKYAANYVNEVQIQKRRDEALEKLKGPFGDTEAYQALEAAINHSRELEETEVLAMRLSLEAAGTDPLTWPARISQAKLTDAEQRLSSQEKHDRALSLITDEQYEAALDDIHDSVERCSTSLIEQTEEAQGQATAAFRGVYLKSGAIVAVFVVMTLGTCAVMRHLVVSPLVSYNESIKRGEIFPVVGAAELQSLAITYNHVYKENNDNLLLIRHQAEHDALTGLLNRRSFDRTLEVYEDGKHSFALILCDVDTFKQVNDTYGHATGDKILQKVATLLKTTYRNIDFVCRTGGDEFAVVMVEMTSDLAYTVEEKTRILNERLLNPDDGLPPVSLSVGVAFADREQASESIYKDADAALYHTKENGRCGCSLYGSF